MRVAVYYNSKDIRIEERPVPKIKKGEILVKVKSSGICGSDLMEWYRIKKAPRVLGHEISGDIVETKNNLFRMGERVFVSHHVPCFNCKYCKEGNHTACDTLHKGNFDPGGFSEYIRIPEINVMHGTYVLPKDFSYDEGAMIEPLACCIRAQRIINIKNFHTVLILGSGVAGLLNARLAKIKGSKVISTDINPYRLKKAKEYGADEIIDAKKEFTILSERIILCTGAIEAVRQAYKSIDRKGIILFFAIPNINVEVPIVDFWRNELSIISSYGAAPDDLSESIELIKNGKVDVKGLITHRLPLTEIVKAFDIAQKGNESLKVIINPN